MLLHAKVKCTPLRENPPVSAQKSACFEVSDRGVCIAQRARNAVFSGLFRGCICIYVRTALMAVFHIILGHLALALLELLRQIIGAKALLQPGVALIALVPQDNEFDTICTPGCKSTQKKCTPGCIIRICYAPRDGALCTP